VPVLWQLAHWDAPLVEDALFWFVPAAIEQAKHGLRLAVEGALPLDVVPPGAPMPPQWLDGLPDNAHPPLWYWWLAGFLRWGASLDAVRAACVLPAALAGIGFVALGEAQGRPWAGLAPWAVPGVLAQLLRPELDLPLLGLTPWALLALRRGRWGAFGVIALVASWVKEPGVLLVVPALVRCARDRELRPQALAPLAGLLAWAAVHGLAPTLGTPASVGQVLENLGVVLRYVALDQGRVLLVLGFLGVLAAPLEASFVAGFVVFFAYVRFDATAGTLDAYTHLRYLLPAVAVYVVTASARLDVPVALAQLYWLHRVHVNGPEGSMAGVDAAYADRAALRSLPAGQVSWVGSYLAAGVGRAWTGYPSNPDTRVYAFGTDPRDIADGDLFVASTYGEPSTRLLHALQLRPVSSWSVGEVRTDVWRVVGHDSRGLPPAALPPR